MFGKNLKKDIKAEMGRMIPAMIGIMIVIMVGALFFSSIQTQVDYLTVPSDSNNNTTYLDGGAGAMYGNVTVFFALGLMFAAIGFVIYVVKEW